MKPEPKLTWCDCIQALHHRWKGKPWNGTDEWHRCCQHQCPWGGLQ